MILVVVFVGRQEEVLLAVLVLSSGSHSAGPRTVVFNYLELFLVFELPILGHGIWTKINPEAIDALPRLVHFLLQLLFELLKKLGVYSILFLYQLFDIELGFTNTVHEVE